MRAMRRVAVAGLLPALWLGGCEALLDLPDPTLANDAAQNVDGGDDDDDSGIDAPEGPADAAFDADPLAPDAPEAPDAAVDAAVPPPDAPLPGPGEHLWLTEVVLTPSDA